MATRIHVTEHAIDQFRRRIMSLPRATVRHVIAAAVQASDPAGWSPAENEQAIRVQIREPFLFRALLRLGEGDALTVVTILRYGNRGAGRKRLAAMRLAARPAHGGDEEAYRHATPTD